MGRTIGPRRRALLPILAVFLQTYPLLAWQTQPLSPAAQKAKDQISAMPTGGKLTVRKVDGTEYHGNLQAIEPDTFSVREVDPKQTVIIAYGDVARVQKNYGRKGFAGQRVDPHRSLIVGAIIVGALITIAIVAVAHDR